MTDARIFKQLDTGETLESHALVDQDGWPMGTAQRPVNVTDSGHIATAADDALVIATVKDLFGATAPPTGWALYNADPSSDIWVSDSMAPVINGPGSIRVQANGGWYETPPGYIPVGKVRAISAGAAKYTARSW